MDPMPSGSRLDMATDRIRAYIENQGLGPGDRLPSEEWFATELQVGRPFVREALKGLEAVGIAESRQGVGRFIRAFEPDTYLRQFTTMGLLQGFTERELIQSRCLLEISAITVAVERLSAQDHEKLSELLATMGQHISERASCAPEDFALHRLIASRGDNRITTAIIDALDALVRAKRPEDSPPILSDTELQGDLAEHQAIVDAVIARDGNRAREELMRHFDTTAKRLGFEATWRHL